MPVQHERQKEKSGRDSKFPNGSWSFEICHRRENKLRLLSKPSVGKSRRLCLFSTSALTVKSFSGRRIDSKAALEQLGPLCYSLWHLRLIMFSGLIRNESIIPMEDKDGMFLQKKKEKKKEVAGGDTPDIVTKYKLYFW